MKKAIRDHLRDFVAIVFLVVIALGVGGYILSNQRFYAPAWVPIFGEDFYELEAELSTAQAVVPGQGQSVNIAGVKVGDIGEVRLVDGRAVVEMKIQPKYSDVYEDATILLRPKTGLKDMFLELDPGTPAAGKLEEGARIGVGNTLPDVNPDEILANLDRDTRDYLKVLLNSGAEALDGDTPAQLRETFKRFEPTSRDGKLITAKLAERRRNISRVIHNLSLLSAELGAGDRQLGELVQSANANFEAIGNQDARLREALRLFPGALDETRTALARVDGFTTELGPALEKLRPGARALGPSLVATRPFLRDTTPVIESQLRPFARDVRPVVRDMRRAAEDLAVVTPHLADTFNVLNALLDTLAYNPSGSEEGFLFWASWLNHLNAQIFTQQDAHGPIRRGLVLISCDSLNTLNAAVRPNNPQLNALATFTNFPNEYEICPNNPPPLPTVPTTPTAPTASASEDDAVATAEPVTAGEVIP